MLSLLKNYKKEYIMNKRLTMSLVFEAQSANYGEGMGNIASLKQLSRGDGKVYLYI